MYPVTSCSVGVHNYAHVVKSYVVSGTGQCFQKVSSTALVVLT
jgi:hypothetical protein